MLEQQEVVQDETEEVWIVIPGIYEKWVHPSNKNDKHYRAIYRSNKGNRKFSDEKFRTATEVLAFANTHNRRVTDAIREQGDSRA